LSSRGGEFNFQKFSQILCKRLKEIMNSHN